MDIGEIYFTEWSFNRTNLELKLLLTSAYRFCLFTFNRTNLELKPLHSPKRFLFDSLLIAPIWN